ncbi:hypothetical protein DPMN_156586 [Dreissena polymorpha]|uniref:Uncharacterized protein n=1 Tax=Dreissena polymorpha TaxID=45954 RepID=A0A9D4FUL2_DREPO|nr:hypothetical protein DPMN_156586 [Dreissena polymorpha]
MRRVTGLKQKGPNYNGDTTHGNLPWGTYLRQPMEPTIFHTQDILRVKGVLRQRLGSLLNRH